MEVDEPPPTWHSPQISLCEAPKTVASGRPQKNEEYPENFFRCAKWCPDGTRVLGQCEDRTLQMLQLPSEIVDSSTAQLDSDPVFNQPSPVLDFAWYPGASASIPGSYCFLASVRECPVKLLDASNGRLRASYKIVDHRERQVAPHSLSFNSAVTHLYCGYEDAIEVFNIQRPGEGTKIPTTPSKKSRDGMKGIVSSIAFCPDYSGLYAASSLTSAITLFSESTGADPVAYLDGMDSAITQVRFDPTRPHLLYAVQRRSYALLCWDVRMPLSVLRRFPNAASRARTNQKLLFDIDTAGRWLATGDEDGHISFYDLLRGEEEVMPSMRIKGHDDSIGSVAFSPVDASLLSVSGSRHFRSMPTERFPRSSKPDSDSSSDSDTSSSEVASENEDEDEDIYEGCRTLVRRRAHLKRPYVVDDSVKLWKFKALVSTTDGTIPPEAQVQTQILVETQDQAFTNEIIQ